MNCYDYYVNNVLPGDIKRLAEKIRWRENFVKEYPADRIPFLTYTDYLYSVYNKQSFCSKIYSNPLASLGNSYTNMFGIYLKGTDLSLSPTFRNYPGYDEAFYEIKKLIVKLLDAAERDNIAELNRNKLNSSFKLMLLTIYYPKKFMPAPTSTAIDAYGRCIGAIFDGKDTNIDKNIKLVNCRNTIPLFAEYDTWIFMCLCDWLWKKSGIVFDSKLFPNDAIRKHVVIDKVEAIEEDPIEDCEYNYQIEKYIGSSGFDKSYAYIPKPVHFPDTEPESLEIKYARDHAAAANALFRADCKCEIDGRHMTFIRKTNCTPYTEAHHLIPLSQQKSFENSIDVTANIVSLCPNCHKQIHYGKNIELMVRKLYFDRIFELERAGIGIDLDRLMMMYK